MRRVILESPFMGKTPEENEANIAYARAAVRDCLLRGESASASHLLFTQPGILRDSDQSERALGMRAGMAWTEVAEAVVVYTDRGISPGMRAGIGRAERLGIPVEHRQLPLQRMMGLAKTEAVSPAELQHLLLSIGWDVDAHALTAAATSPADVAAAARWARAEHEAAQGNTPAVGACPAWLAPLLIAPKT